MTWREPTGVLAELVAGARDDCAARRARASSAGQGRPVGRGREVPGRFRAALVDRLGVAVIAEVKRSSPSAGSLRPAADAAELARTYVAAGACCISVLTEGRRFGGSLDDLRAVRDAVDVPILRKDFIVDPYMVHEAAEAGADCVLLIAAAVEPVRLLSLASLARDLGLDVLLEVIYERDLAILERLDFPLVGVNARDLETLDMDASRFGRMAPRVSAPGRVLVAESGVRGPADVSRYRSEGAEAVLVGEAAMRAADPSAFIRALVRAP